MKTPPIVSPEAWEAARPEMLVTHCAHLELCRYDRSRRSLRRSVVAGKNSRWAKRRRIALAELVSAPWCAPTPGSFAQSLLADALKEEGLPVPQVNAVSFSIPLYNALLATGNFLCLLPNSMLQLGRHLVSVKVLPIELPARPGPVGIITLKKRTLSPVARLFIEHAREVTKPLAKLK